MIKIVDRNGEITNFSRKDIALSLRDISTAVSIAKPRKGLSDQAPEQIVGRLYERLRKRPEPATIQEIEDLIEIDLMKMKAYEVAKEYIIRRYIREQQENNEQN